MGRDSESDWSKGFWQPEKTCNSTTDANIKVFIAVCFVFIFTLLLPYGATVKTMVLL